MLKNSSMKSTMDRFQLVDVTVMLLVKLSRAMLLIGWDDERNNECKRSSYMKADP